MSASKIGPTWGLPWYVDPVFISGSVVDDVGEESSALLLESFAVGVGDGWPISWLIGF
ncbi:hypothetical protein D3C80_1793130 [compost metagenome]